MMYPESSRETLRWERGRPRPHRAVSTAPYLEEGLALRRADGDVRVPSKMRLRNYEHIGTVSRHVALSQTTGYIAVT